MTDELELKYAVGDSAALEAWLDRQFPPPTSGDEGWRNTNVTDRYFDTADRALERSGYGARLRRIGSQVSVTVKSDGRSIEGLHRRIEQESPAVDALRPARWPPSPVRELVEGVTGQRRLIERFVLRQRRRERRHPFGETGACLISIDQVVVSARGERLAELSQLEVELIEGDESVLREVARLIDGSGLAMPERRSKMAIAAVLVDASRPVAAEDPFPEAGRRVLHRHLLRMLDREVGVRAGDELALKQMRVATRRMRAVWRVFDGAYRRPTQRRYLGELRQVARRLGAVRDLDVLIEALPDVPDLGPMAADWRARRRRAFDDLVRLLDGRAYRRFVGDYLTFAGTPGAAVADGAAEARVRDLAGGRIWRAYERVRAHETALGDADIPALHALRVDAKRLRYTLETFNGALPRKRIDQLMPILTRLQDHLGALNDADIGARETAEWLEHKGRGAGAATRQAVQAELDRRRADIERLRLTFGAVWRDIVGRGFGDELAAAVAAL